MKKLYIYILIGLLCFLGFNGEVEADYQEICSYRKSENVNSVSASQREYSVKILYDKSNSSEPYKVTVQYYSQAQKEDSVDSASKIKIDKSYAFKPIAKGYYESDIYLTKNFSSNKCPKNVAIHYFDNKTNPAGYKRLACFYDDTSGYNTCKEILAEKHGGNTKMEFDATIVGKKVETTTASNIENGKICNEPITVTGGDSTKLINCPLTFTYSNGNLKITYNDSEKGEKEVTGNTFECGSYEEVYGGHGQTHYYDRIFHFDTAKVGVSPNIQVRDLTEFKKKYIQEWDETGSCPKLIIDPVGDGLNSKEYYILFEDAAEYVEENGSDVVDSKNFVELKDFDKLYKWPEWNPSQVGYEDCEGLLGPDIMKLLNDIFLYVKILIPVALIGFGIIDFVKAVFSSKEDDMKKAQNRFIKRLIIAAIIFILPSIVNALLNTINGIWAHINNSACNIWD